VRGEGWERERGGQTDRTRVIYKEKPDEKRGREA